MAKITPPRQTIFVDPNVIQPAQPSGVAGLPERLEAQRIRQNVATLRQATNFVQNAVDFGVDIDNLLNQNASGEFEVAKAQAEARLKAEQQRAAEPEPLEERLTREPGEAPPVGPGVPPLRAQDDMELYEERFPELLTDITDIGKELKGRAKKAYDMWVQTQAPGWQGAMHGMYAQRVKDSAESNYNVAIAQNRNDGKVLEVVALYERAINEGIWDGSKIAEQRMEDISAAFLTNVTRAATTIADEAGYEEAKAFLDQVRGVTEEGPLSPEQVKEYRKAAGFLTEDQLEGVRRDVAQRLNDKFTQDERVYEQQVKRPAEDKIQDAMHSWITGDNYGDTGVPATSQDVEWQITNQGLRGEDQRPLLKDLQITRKALADGVVSDGTTLGLAMTMSLDSKITPEEMRRWAVTQMQAQKLSVDHAEEYILKKNDNFFKPRLATSAAIIDATLESDITFTAQEAAFAND
ncbi:MAG: hypothetical protein KAJ19_08775, partial [Gammaproteobacteria bacterium]|nr:hypothetical protein [Gammaproteobacteria bacterium]